VNREAQSVLLLLVGGAVLRISISDVYLRYVKEGLRPFLIVSGALLVAIAVATLVREMFNTKTEDAHEHADDDGHGHGHGTRIGWMLILPVFATFLIAPPALGSYAASRGGQANIAQPTADFAPLPKADPAKITVVEYFTRAVWDKGGSMKDRNIQLSGFITPRPEGGVYLTRIMLSCCAVDGRPIKVALSGDGVDDLPADTWVELVGQHDPKIDKDKVNKQEIPYFKVSQVKKIPAPKQPYEQ
jgi:uncharacterized repeat protein (TIGR03943 family)